MKIVVLGATGNVGSRVTRRAADAGHEVVAFVRRPAAVDVHRNVTTARGAPEDTDALAAAARGADAVLVSITGKTSDASFMQDRLPGIIDAVRQAGVTRLVLVSVFGAGDTVDKASGVAKIVYKSVLRKFLADKTVADGILEASGLDWTIVYPVNLKAAPALAEGPVIKDLRDVGKVPGLPTLPMDDAAAAILDVITDLDTVGRKLLITTPRGWTAAASSESVVPAEVGRFRRRHRGPQPEFRGAARQVPVMRSPVRCCLCPMRAPYRERKGRPPDTTEVLGHHGV